MEHESNRQTTMEGIDGGLHPAVDGQSLDETRRDSRFDLLCLSVVAVYVSKQIHPRDTFACGWDTE